MRTLLRPFLLAWRRALLSAAGVRLGRGVEVQACTCVRHIFAGGRRGSIVLGEGATVSHGAVIESWGGDVRLERRVFIGPHCVIYGHGGVRIGPDTLVSMHCRILSSNHTVPPAGRPIRSEPDVLLPTAIGADVWLGAGVTVLGGVTIGDGAVIGAGAVITHDVPPNVVAAGVPARVLRPRL